MSADVIYLKRLGGRCVAAEAHVADAPEETPIAPERLDEVVMRLVYCMAAGDEDGMARARARIGRLMSAAPSRRSL